MDMLTPEEERKLLRGCLAATAALMSLFTVAVIAVYEIACWVWFAI